MEQTIGKRMPTYFLSHGGGPWPWMDGPFRDAYADLEASLKEMPGQVGTRPTAILMISGHWIERDFTVMTSPAPGMIYDYGGFPAHTYHIRYGAPGSPRLAERVRTLLAGAGFGVGEDSERGFDHGAFVPLAVAYPKADIPVVQLSLRADFDPAIHLDAGRALSVLRDEGVLIVGSGLSYHNLRRFDDRAMEPSHEFDAWLRRTVLESSPEGRAGGLLQWAQAPSARFAHPMEDHLIPLMVAAGAAEKDPASMVYHEDAFFGGIAVSSFRFG